MTNLLSDGGPQGTKMTTHCQAIRDLLPTLLLGDAESRVSDRIAEHLAGCAGCRGESDRLSALLGSLSTEDVPDPGDAYWEAFLPRLRNRIAREAVRAAGPSPWRPWAVAASVAVLVLGAATVLTLQPSAESGSRMAVSSLAAQMDPESLDRTLDEILPGSEMLAPERSAGGPDMPRPADLQRALDSLIPQDDSDLLGAAGELSPEARQWLLRAWVPDRV
jgi:hypothetical protein